MRLSTALDLLIWLGAAAAAEQVTVDAQGEVADAFDAALQLNVVEHEAQMEVACSHFSCGVAADYDVPPMSRWSMGPVHILNDYAEALEGEEQIFVSDQPLFSPAECEAVIRLSELEGEGLPSSQSGKYKLGKAWIRDMPQVKDWFNEALRTKLFPTLAHLFPTIVSNASLLRAHSVAVLKYNASHPRTDIHVDDALLAFTVALSHPTSFEGGGTYFEHIDRVLPMPQGHATFRPGGVRHGGHAVTAGLRYVIGGFIAVADKVEHVARLNERGNRILLQPEPPKSELRQAELHRARFGLGVALRAQRRDAEAVSAYESALEVTPRDFDTWANMAAALGSLGLYGRETAAYRKAVEIRPDDVKAWLNLGISHTSAEEHTEAEQAFAAAAAADPHDPRPPMNLGRLLASLSRPAEAVAAFYAASALNAEYFDEVKLGVGTARAMQGRLQQAAARRWR